MNTTPKTVVIYCASSAKIDPIYLTAAKELAHILAENQINCITGAGKAGLMGAINDSVLENGGVAIGIIPQFMVDSNWFHPCLTKLIVTDTIHDRKKQMAELSDAVIALPGGLGTLEELAEILTWKQLGLYNKPIIILNTNGYYDLLLDFFEKMMEEKFMDTRCRQLWQVVASPQDILRALQEENKQLGKIPKYNEKEL